MTEYKLVFKQWLEKKVAKINQKYDQAIAELTEEIANSSNIFAVLRRQELREIEQLREEEELVILLKYVDWEREEVTFDLNECDYTFKWSLERINEEQSEKLLDFTKWKFIAPLYDWYAKLFRNKAEEEKLKELPNSTEISAELKLAQEKIKELEETATLQKRIDAECRTILETELTTTQQQLTQLRTSQAEQQATTALYQTKITDLENQLINLAKQKIKGKKEAQELLNQLEQNWKQTQTDLEHQLTTQKSLVNEKESKIQTTTENLSKSQKKIKELQTELTTTKTQKDQLTTTLTQTNQELTTTQNSLTNQTTNLHQLQSLHELRKKQGLAFGAIALALILYLGWPTEKEPTPEESKTWT